MRNKRSDHFKSINDMIKYFKTIDAHSDKGCNGLESLRKFIKNSNNFYYLNSGKFYDVWCTMRLSEPYVIKVVKDVWARVNKYRSYNQRFPRKNTKIAKHFLYPIWHSSCHSIIVQPKVNTEIQAVNNAEDFFWKKGIMYSDWHEGNFGMFEGRPVIIDYLHE